MNTFELREAIRTPYAWPGGYPTFILLSDGECLCHSCARENYRALSESLRHSLSDGWQPVAHDINWEDYGMYCVHCNQRIESAYGEPVCTT